MPWQNHLKSHVELDPYAKTTTFFTFAKNAAMREGKLAVAVLQRRYPITLDTTGKPGFKAVRFVSDTSQDLNVSELMSLAETEAELNVNRQTPYRLIDDGHLVESEATGNSRLLTRQSVLEFGSRHRNAREILPYFGGNLDQFVKLMGEYDVEPVLEKRSKHEAQPVNVIYRYADIARVMGLRNDPTRFNVPEFETFWTKLRSLCADMPPYLQLPSRLPVSGQTISNGKRTHSFVVTYDPVEHKLILEGKRQASGLGILSFRVNDKEGSLARFRTDLMSIVIPQCNDYGDNP